MIGQVQRDTKKNYQLYGRNDMIMLDEHNKIYGSLGLAEPYIVATKEGETLLLNGAKDNEPFIGLSLYGKSHQNTVAGNQLIPMTVGEEIVSKDGFVSAICTEEGIEIEAMPGASVKAPSDIYFIGTGISINDYEEYPDFEAGMTYTAKCDSINYSLYVSALRGGVRITLCRVNLNTESGTFSPQEGDAFLVLLRPNKNFTEAENEVVHVMISSNTNALIWEPYTGGQPSPNPDYPQEIESVGDDGNIQVVIAGENIIDSSKVTDGMYVLSDGTLAANSSYVAFDWTEIIPGIEYHINYSLGESYWVFADANYNVISFVSGNAMNQIAPENAKYTRISCSKKQWQSMSVAVYITSDYVGSNYAPMQSLIVSTPNGLPGIPVSSGGNYTDENGQQWISDEIDFKRGKYVQRVRVLTLTGASSEVWNKSANQAVNVFVLSVENEYTNHMPLLCTHFSYDGHIAGKIGYVWPTQDKNRIGFGYSDSSVDETTQDFRNFLSQNPVKLYYVLATPIETDLTPEQIAAYQSLHTNYPTTTIMNDSDAGMKAIYKQIENGG